MNLKITFLELLPDLTGPNELNPNQASGYCHYISASQQYLHIKGMDVKWSNY